MSPPPQHDTSNLSPDNFAVQFSSKIGKIRKASAPVPTYVVRSTVATSLSSFKPVDTVEIIRPLSRTPGKHCQLNPVPTWLIKRVAVVLQFNVHCVTALWTVKVKVNILLYSDPYHWTRFALHRWQLVGETKVCSVYGAAGSSAYYSLAPQVHERTLTPSLSWY